MGYSFRLTARVLLYASHRQDDTYHGLSYTSHGALAGTRNSSMGPPWRIDLSMGPPWRIDLTIHRTMSEHSYHLAPKCVECVVKKTFPSFLHLDIHSLFARWIIISALACCHSNIPVSSPVVFLPGVPARDARWWRKWRRRRLHVLIVVIRVAAFKHLLIHIHVVVVGTSRTRGDYCSGTGTLGCHSSD